MGTSETMLVLSVVFVFITLLLFVLISVIGSRSLEGRLKTKGSRVPILIIGVAGALWCLHYAVGYYTAAGKLSWPELASSSLLKTAKIIGVDENVDSFVLELRGMLGKLLGQEHFLQNAIGIYAGVLYVVAPVLGGIGLLEILAGFFPHVRLWTARFIPWKGKYYFSQLHDGSLEMARHIADIRGFWKSFKKPVLIFTGVNVDKGDMVAVRRLEEAKALGAICLRSDLKSTAKWGWGERKFFLVEEDELVVLQQLAALTTDKNSKYLKKAEVFFFVTSEAYVSLETHIWEELRLKGIKSATFHPVRINFNLIKDLLTRVPLFEPLMRKEKNPDGTQDLTVAIMGIGGLGMEMLLNTYWIGQMLDCNLTIRVYAQEDETEFWSKLDHVNAEIRQSAQEEHPILQIYPNQYLRAKPYCRILYQQCKLDSGNLGENEEGLRDADYCLVALGSDTENIAVAQAVSRCVGERHIARNNGSKTVIAYVVYDPDFAQLLNSTLRREQKNEQDEQLVRYAGDLPDVYMLAIGSLPEVYSLRSVLATDDALYIQTTADAYQMLQDSGKRKQAFQSRIGVNGKKQRLDAGYKYWESMARVMHRPYKLYSAGLLRTSLFDDLTKEAFRGRRNKEIANGIDVLKGNCTDSGLSEEAYVRLLHRLAWLEHRRWNAFTRVMGYRHTTLYEAYRIITHSHKHMPLKLHPCLVECDQLGIKSRINRHGMPEEKSRAQTEDDPGYDKLDALTYHLNQLGLVSYDMKYWDYPYEFLD